MKTEEIIKELYSALEFITSNSEEDCPQEYRSDSFKESLIEANGLLEKYKNI